MKSVKKIILLSVASFWSVAYESQYGQDKYIVEEIFKFKRNGVFVDIGAFDGKTLSNTYFLEKTLDWTGICIEPNEDVFNLLVKNRRCICVQGCIFDETGEKDFLKVTGYSQMLSGLIETYDNRHSRRIDTEIAQKGGSKQSVKVKTFNLNDLCKQNNISHIDFLSIDTEGSEEKIIRSIDFEKIFIDVIAIENNFNSSFFNDFLINKNYKLICKLGVDEIYQKIL